MKDSHGWTSFSELLSALGLDASPKRVLVVEDDDGLRDALVRALSPLGHPVDAYAGVERDDLPLRGYEAAFLDNYFVSSTLTGVTLTPELVWENPRIRIVAMSSDAGKNAEMMRMGASLAVSKSALRRLR